MSRTGRLHETRSALQLPDQPPRYLISTTAWVHIRKAEAVGAGWRKDWVRGLEEERQRRGWAPGLRRTGRTEAGTV